MMQTHNIEDLLNQEIDKLVDEKVFALSKSPLVKIDKEKIRNEMEAYVYEELVHEGKHNREVIQKLIEHLKEDNPQLYDKIFNVLSTLTRSSTNIKLKTTGTDLAELKAVGIDWMEKGNEEKAYECFLTLTLVDTENAEVWLLRGMAEHNQHDYSNARTSYVCALTLAPQYTYAYLQLMKCLIAAENKLAAEECYKLFLKEVDPGKYAHDDFVLSQISQIKSVLKAA